MKTVKRLTMLTKCNIKDILKNNNLKNIQNVT